jgi:nicotinamidase/pyrazinamidase
VLWPDHCVQGTPGAAFHPNLDTQRAQLVVRKGFHRAIDSYSGFLEADRETTTGLAGFLKEKGYRRLYVSGLATDFCVAWTALDARATGFEVGVIDDACRAIDLDGSLARAWRDLEAAGVKRTESGTLLARSRA